MRSPGRRVFASSAFLVLILASGCSSGAPTPGAARATPAAVTSPASRQPKWVPVDLPGQYSEFRSALYDPARDCVWVMTREEGTYASDPEFVTLTRINVVDRSITYLPFKLNADGYDIGLMALDAQDVLWMAWGSTLARFDPVTEATRQWTRPPYSGLARVYSMDGRMDAMTISSDGEIWLAAGMLSAVFGFNPKTDTWDRPIGLPFVPVEWRTELAAPAPGIITINGIALQGGALDPNASSRFAVITTATRDVKTTSLPVYEYVSLGGGQILYWDGAGNLVRWNILKSTSTVIGTLPRIWDGSPSLMAVDPQGNVWLPVTTQGFPGVEKLDPSSGAVAQFPFPIVIRFYRPRPSSTSCFMPHSCFPLECKPMLASDCVPRPMSLDPDVEGLAPDADGDLWMVTASPSSSTSHVPYGPVIELQPSS